MAPAVLVTGGLGFIGAHVVRELLREGTPVIVIDREVAGNAADEVLSVDQRASLRRVAGTIPGVRALTRLLREHMVETVVHLASPLATVTEGNPRLVTNEMIAPQVAILDACRLAKVRRLVWASSVGVFGRAQDYPGLPISGGSFRASNSRNSFAATCWQAAGRAVCRRGSRIVRLAPMPSMVSAPACCCWHGGQRVGDRQRATAGGYG